MYQFVTSQRCSTCFRCYYIRLLCLAGVEDETQPIHITLETYRRDECREYETVSYTWAEENGDTTRFETVYIAPHWDLLPQTRNC